jgi:hypothetical protein
VIAALIFLITRYFTTTSENLKVSQSQEIINTLTRASYHFLEGQPDFKNISLSQLVQLGLIPNTFLLANANPWRGSIDVKPSSDNSKVVIILSRIPTTSCNNLIEKMRKLGTDLQCSGQGDSVTFQGTF